MKKIISLALSAVMCLGMGITNTVTANAATVPSNANLLNTYGNVFGKVGTALVASEILDNNLMNYAAQEYNSMTVGNEMKPDYLLGWSAKLISVEEAKSLGYYIPDNYPESTVPKLDFSTIDKMMKSCYEKGFAMRGHTLVWHSQTPDWFFKSGYNKNSGDVSKEVMNKRMEFFIKTYMNHIHTSEYKDVIYAWDVVNEYLHGDTESNSGWQRIYGKNLRSKAEFVKLAFQYANQTLEYFKLTDKVKLFYNDYNTYMEVKEVVDLINFINSDKKICAGIGMQSHLSTDFPSVDYYRAALDAFAKAGFEIQITELDVGCKDQNTQAKYYYDLMKTILDAKKKGANITALVWWGMTDDTSWRAKENPLLYSKLNVKKPAYNSVLQAYFDSGYTLDGSGNSNNNNSNNNNNNNNNNNGNSNNNNNNNNNGNNNNNNDSNNNNNNNTTNPGTSAGLADGWYYLKNVHAQKYLTVKNDNGKTGENVELVQGLGIKGQKWYLKNIGNGYITLQSGLGNFMLDVAYGQNKDGANIGIYNAYSGNAQQFALKAVLGKNVFGVTTKSSNGTKALDDYNFGTSNGANVCQWTYTGSANQLWVFEKAYN